MKIMPNTTTKRNQRIAANLHPQANAVQELFLKLADLPGKQLPLRNGPKCRVGAKSGAAATTPHELRGQAIENKADFTSGSGEIGRQTISPRPLLNPRNPKKTNSFFFDVNKLDFRARSRQQPSVGTRCRQSVQNPVQSVGLNVWLRAAVSCVSVRPTRYRRLETQQVFSTTDMPEAGRGGPHCKLRPCARARTWCLNLVWRSARKWIHPANAYARKITKTTPSAVRQSNLRKRSKGEKSRLRAGGWAEVAYWQPNDLAIFVVSP